MTVIELIEQLQKLPANLPVYLADWNEGYAPDYPMTVNDGPVVEMAQNETPRRASLPERVVLGGKP